MISGEWISMLWVTGGLIFAAILAHRFLPLLRQSGGPNHSLKHLGTLALTPHCSVALVQVGRETLVLGVSAQSVSLLAKAGGPECEEDLQSERKAAEPKRAEASPATLPGLEGKGFSSLSWTPGKRR